ncbi:MAG: hypothetical protein ABMA26_07215 [Limisphaerales bacterium]
MATVDNGSDVQISEQAGAVRYASSPRRRSHPDTLLIHDFTVSKVAGNSLPTEPEALAGALMQRFLDVYERSRQQAGGSAATADPANTIYLFTATLMRHLHHLINQGDPRAAAALAHLSTSGVMMLNEVALNRPELLKEYAGHCVRWPVLASQSSVYRHDFERIKAQIGLGEKPFFTEEVAFSLIQHGSGEGEPGSKALRGAAMVLLLRIEHFRQSHLREVISDPPPYPTPSKKIVKAITDLPDFGAQQSWTAWHAVAWQIVREDSNGKPEKSDFWGHYSKQLRAKEARRRKFPTRFPHLAPLFPSREREVIQRQLKRVIRSLAKSGLPLVDLNSPFPW